MKLVPANLIEKSEAQFYEEICSILNLNDIGELLKNKISNCCIDKVKFQNLDVTVHNNKIAFRFDLKAQAYFSIFIDRSGNFLKMEEAAEQSRYKINSTNHDDGLFKSKSIRKEESLLTKTIAFAIERQTLERLVQEKSRTKLNGRLAFLGAQFDVHQNQPVYKMIYQGEIALSFLVDQGGRFLEYVDVKRESKVIRRASESPEANEVSKTEDHILANGEVEIEIQESICNSDLGLTPNYEIKNIEKEIFCDTENPDKRSPSISFVKMAHQIKKPRI